MYLGFDVKYRLFLSDFIKLAFFGQIFKQSSNIKFHGSPYSEGQVVPYRQTDMKKLIVAFHNCTNAPKT